ncbi:MAG: hypothetical protein AAGJ19_07980 [Myxococcota bacterium]
MGNPSTLTTEGMQRWPSAIQPNQLLDPLAFGGPVELGSKALRDESEGFVNDVSNVLRHFAEEDWQRFREHSREFVSELRRAFLRSHRRLSVHVRSEGVESFDRVVAVESVELARRFRDLILGRSSRVVHETWPVLGLYEALDRISGYLPEALDAPYEPRSFVGQSGDSFGDGLRRWTLRMRRRWRRLVGRPELSRRIRLRALGQRRLLDDLPEALEGMASILLQAELQLSLRSRQLFSDIEAALVKVGEASEAEQAKGLLDRLKAEAEEAFLLAESEQQQHGLDALKRIQSALGQGVQRWKRDLETAGTFELQMDDQPTPGTEALSRRLQVAQEELGGVYAVSAMRIEFAAFHQDLEEGLEDFIENLEKDIRGRSFTQLERVGQALDTVLEALQEVEGDDQLIEQGRLQLALEPLERVVQEAFKESGRLGEQLVAEGATQPLVDTLTRVASGLTDRYRVPLAAMERSEWRIPQPSGLCEIPFADLVTTYVQVDLAPHLIERTSRASNDLEPMQSTLSDVERLVRYNPDQYGSELELEGTGSLGPLGIREALLTAARTHREALESLQEKSAHWSRDMGRDLRRVVNQRLDAFAERLREGEVQRIRTARRRRSRIVEGGFGFALPSFKPLRELWGRSGLESRFQRLRRTVRAQGRRRSRQELEALLSPPRFAQIPVYYRRLFAPQSHWAGDIAPSDPVDIERATEVLKKSVAGLRTAAVVGVDGAGRGAVVSAVLQRAGFASIRRLNLLKPTGREELEEGLAELGRDQLVVITGLGYLMSSEPGGFAPLQRLTEIIVEDGGRNAWLLEVDDLVWRFGAQATPIRGVFLERVGVRSLDREELGRAIFARHHLSGMELEFVARGRSEKASSEGHGEGPVQQEFFRELHRASGGLLQVALTLWLAAIEGFAEDAKRIQVREVPPTPKAALDELPDADVELLYLVLRQGWMCTSTLAFVLQLDAMEAEGRLRRLVHRGLLERSVDEVYVVRRHLRGVAHELLQSRNFV